MWRRMMMSALGVMYIRRASQLICTVPRANGSQREVVIRQIRDWYGGFSVGEPLGAVSLIFRWASAWPVCDKPLH
jgi:hypothetical protein